MTTPAAPPELPKETMWRLVSWVLGLTLVVGVALLLLDRHERELVAEAGAHEGYAWTVAQYQLAFQRVRSTLCNAGDGDIREPARQALKAQAEVLSAHTHVVTDPSEYASFFQRLPDYHHVSMALRRLNDRLTSAVGTHENDTGVDPVLGAADVKALMMAFAELDPPVVSFANDVRAAEVQAAERLRQGIDRYRQWLWLAIGIAWGILVFWVILLARSRARHQRTAVQLQTALDAEQQARAELQEAQLARNQFMGMVSHELRSPLQSILSALDLLDTRGGERVPLDHTGASSSESPALLVARIRRAATALEGQLRDLLTLAQGEAGQLELRPEVFEAVALVEEVVDQWQPQANAKGLQLQLKVSLNPIFVVADPLRITQLVANLVSNAVKYTERGQILVGVSLQQGSDDAGPPTTTLILTVEDTGPGIPQALQSRIFGAWRRFGSVSGRGQSAGIGLAIVHTIVQHLGGQVELQSQEGQGSRFAVNVPVLLADAAEAGHDGVDRGTEPSLPSGAERAASHHLLIVDDRPDVLEALRSVACELGIRCDVANGGPTAANLLATHHYDTVLIDLNMPVKSGQELASETRRGAGPSQHARLLAMSAADLDGVGQVWPFDGFVAKPVTMQRLAVAVLGK